MPIDGIKGSATSHASTSNIATDEQIAQLTNLTEKIKQHLDAGRPKSFFILAFEF